MREVYLSFGGNLGNPLACFAEGLSFMQRAGQIVSRSGIYRTAPQGGPPQPDYYNAVVCLETVWDCQEVLKQAQAAEQACGRERLERFGPRTLDIDVLLCGGLVLDSPVLQVPHPRMAQRRFVLAPLAEIAPGLTIPGVGEVSGLLAQVAGQEVVRVMDWPGSGGGAHGPSRG